MSQSYWEISISEILSQHGVDLDCETVNSIASDVESCASVESDYSAPAFGYDEVAALKAKILKLESRMPCHRCGGKGGEWAAIGASHSSYDDCYVCNGKGWTNG